MSDKDLTYDCERVKAASDEYFHAELHESEAAAIESHLSECSDCRTYYDEEKKLTDMIKASVYTSEISFSSVVMKKITDERITIKKPQRKRPIPFGLISAAVIVFITFALNRDIFNITDKTSQINESQTESAKNFADWGELKLEGGDDSVAGENKEYHEENEENEDSDDVRIEPRINAYSISDNNSYDSAAEQPVAEEKVIPVPTGPFSVDQHPIGLLICVSVGDDTKEKLILRIKEEAKSAETDANDDNIIYFSKESYDLVTDILLKNGIEFDIREMTSDANDIAIFFY